MQQIINELNNLKILQKSIDWREDLDQNTWEKFFEYNELVAEELDVDKHRHYELVTDVYKIGDKYLGIRRIGDLYSEMSSCEDIYWTLKFFEMKQIKTISYEEV